MARKRRRNAPWRPRLLGGAALVAVAACAVALRRRCDGAAHVVVKDGVRWLVQGGDVIGAAYLGHPDYAAFRGWAVQRVAAAARPAAANALVVGVGAGSVVNHLRRTLDADAVELDADVARLATEHFGVKAKSVHCGDGVALLRTAGRRYDLVLVDVVDPSSAATTVAALDAAVATPRVAAGGLLVLNVVALDDAEGLEFLRFAASALAKRFAVVRAVRDSPPEDAGATNVAPRWTTTSCARRSGGRPGPRPAPAATTARASPTSWRSATRRGPTLGACATSCARRGRRSRG